MHHVQLVVIAQIVGKIVGPYPEDRTTLQFAALVEREFGGFVAPKGF